MVELQPYCWGLKLSRDKEGHWKCHMRYKGQDCFSSFLSMQQTIRCQLTDVALYACHEATNYLTPIGSMHSH